ncbi:MAG: 3-hydroxyacyl-ACP dehydratase FabZ family protein [Phycisphaerae bacterium]
MKFVLVDRINELVPGERVQTEKALSLAEEYLADHFPTFPVMPGVLMLEAMVQSAAWLMRATTDFAHSVVVLAEARNITYKSFVSPGRVLAVRVEVVEQGPGEWRLKGRGSCGEQEMVRGQLRMRQYNLRSGNPAWADVDAELVRQARTTFRLLGGVVKTGGTV